MYKSLLWITANTALAPPHTHIHTHNRPLTHTTHTYTTASTAYSRNLSTTPPTHTQTNKESCTVAHWRLTYREMLRVVITHLQEALNATTWMLRTLKQGIISSTYGQPGNETLTPPSQFQMSPLGTRELGRGSSKETNRSWCVFLLDKCRLDLMQHLINADNKYWKTTHFCCCAQVYVSSL